MRKPGQPERQEKRIQVRMVYIIRIRIKENKYLGDFFEGKNVWKIHWE